MRHQRKQQNGCVYPVVSVVINNYNYGCFLKQAVRSVLEQDFPSDQIEIIVVDDGSTDDSRKVLLSFGNTIRSIFQQNRGQAGALNAGLKAAQGEIVCLLDSDDWWQKNKIQRVVARFREDASLGMVQHMTHEVDEGGNPLPKYSPPVPPTYRLQDFLETRTYFTGTSGLSFKSEVIQKLLPIPEELFYCADEYLYTHILFFAPVGNIPEVLAFRRVHGGNRYALVYHDPARLENRLAVRRLLRESLDQRLKEHRLKLSTAVLRQRRLEKLQEEFFLNRYRGHWREAFGILWEITRSLSGKYKAFKLITLLIALASPKFYLLLFELYARYPPLVSLRQKIFKE